MIDLSVMSSAAVKAHVTQATFTISQSNEPAAGQPEDNGGKINKTALISTVSVIVRLDLLFIQRRKLFKDKFPVANRAYFISSARLLVGGALNIYPL